MLLIRNVNMPSHKIQFILKNNRQSEIHFLEGEVHFLMSQLLHQMVGRYFVIIDEKLTKVFPCLIDLIQVPTLVLSGTESSKSLETVEKIIHFLHENQCRRADFLIVIGGGCLGDVSGFAASIYKRGITWHFFPTTLIAQVDSSIGGKVAINTPYGKNQIGAFWPARHVYIINTFLQTLDVQNYNAGFAEIIKLALLVGGDLLKVIQADEMPAISKLVILCVEAKLKVIDEDWIEDVDGTRIGLNFGHTIGHAIEKISPNLLHGEAVALGMKVELYLAKCMGKLTFCVQNLDKLLGKFNLPTAFQHYISEEQWPSFSTILTQDKKNETDNICFVIPLLDKAKYASPVQIKKLHLSLTQLKKNLFYDKFN